MTINNINNDYETPCVMIIAGSDSCSGAGIQADLKAITLNQVYASCVITCLTAQNTQKVSGICEVSSDFIRQQIQAVVDDLSCRVIKTGMLSSIEIIDVVASEINKIEQKFLLVVDPVMVATSGDILLKNNAIDALKSQLISRAFLVTPNIDEAQILSNSIIKNLDDMKLSALKIKAIGCKSVLIKGGHLNLNNQQIDNLLLDEFNQFHVISNPRVAVEKIHGTGCTLASAISANLAKKLSLCEAVKLANQFVFEGAKNCKKIGKGSLVLGLNY